MPTNVFFNHAVQSEQNLVEDLVVESLRFYGHSVYYLPRKIINEDTISDECRNIIEDYLPSINILPDLTSPIGKGLINGNPVLFIMGSDILGTSLDLNTSEITIASTANSIIDTLTESDYNLKLFKIM